MSENTVLAAKVVTVRKCGSPEQQQIAHTRQDARIAAWEGEVDLAANAASGLCVM